MVFRKIQIAMESVVISCLLSYYYFKMTSHVLDFYFIGHFKVTCNEVNYDIIGLWLNLNVCCRYFNIFNSFKF